MNCSSGVYDTSKGWELLLSKVDNVPRRTARVSRKREWRSCRWLRDHDPCTVDSLLESALVGKDKKTRLAAVGTLLAATDALQKGITAPAPSLSVTGSTWARDASDAQLLTGLAVSLAGRFVPLLTAIAAGAPSQSPTRNTQQDTSAEAAVGSGDEPSSMWTAANAVASGTAATMSPTALTCFAAECALALTSMSAVVASSAAASPGAATPGAGYETVTLAPIPPSSPTTQAAGGKVIDECGIGAKGVAAVLSVDQADETPEKKRRREIPSARQIEIDSPADSHGGPPEAAAKVGVVKDVKDGAVEEGPNNRRRALKVLSELFPVSTIPLLLLAEAWLGGAEGKTASGAAWSSSDGSSNVRNNRALSVSDMRGVGSGGGICWDDGMGSDVSAASDSRDSGVGKGRSAYVSDGGVGGAINANTESGGRQLAVAAVRDLTGILVSQVDVARRLEERDRERRRVRERDGLEEGTASSPTHVTRDVVAIVDGLTEHAAWHLARTLSMILSSRRWPTAKLKGVGGSATGGWEGGRGAGDLRSELVGLVGELRACDPRVLEMAGVEPPQGVEEGRWLALRRICVCLGGAKTKELFRTGGVGTRLDGDGGNDDGGDELVGRLQEALVRSLCGARREAQKLASSALVWIMSTALQDGNGALGSDGRSADRVEVAPLLGLLNQKKEGEEDGDAASDGARFVLMGLSVKRPLLVVPEVLKAAEDTDAATSPGDASGASPDRSAARLSLTMILAEALRGTNGGRVLDKGGISPFDGVGEHLIQCLGNDDLRVRTAASTGLVSLDPGWVIPRICRWLSEQEASVNDARLKRDEGGVSDFIGGSGWGSAGSGSAALQALGDIVVYAHDPPDALSALLDSLRNDPQSALGGNFEAAARDDSDGRDCDGVGSRGSSRGGKTQRGLVDRVMGSLSLWARRLKKRSDSHHRACVSSRKASRRPAPGRSPAALTPAADAPAAVAAPGTPAPNAGRAAVAAEEEEEEDQVEDSTTNPSTEATALTLYGECLEVAAIKALAAPAERLPVRFFAVLAAAVCAGADDEAAAVTTSDRGGSVLAGVLETVRGRMNGQPRLTEKLLSDESQEASETVKLLLFSRISPLLILGALPPAALVLEDQQEQVAAMEFYNEDSAVSGEGMENFHTQSLPVVGRSGHEENGFRGGVRACLEEIRALLLERTERLYEYDQVRKMSAELSGTLPPRLVLPGVVSTITRFSESVESARSGAKPEGSCAENDGDDALASPKILAARALFTACHAARSHWILLGPWVAPLLSAVIRVALLPAIPEAGGDVVQVQHGAINFLAVLLQQASAQAPATIPVPIMSPTERASSRRASTDLHPGIPIVSTVDPPAPTAEQAPPAFQTSPATATPPSSSTATLALPPKIVQSDIVQPKAVQSATTATLEIGDVPGFVASIAVGGVLPEGFRRRNGGDWLEMAFREALRREREEVGRVEGQVAGEEDGTGGGGATALLPAQLRMCFANSAVTVARRCSPEFLPALCSRGNFLGSFLTGASRGSGLLRAACLQVVFALVYRTKGLFGGGSTIGSGGRGGVNCTCDDVMQVACDALGKEQHPEVRLSGLKLLLGVVAAGASPSAAARLSSAASPEDDPRPIPPLIPDVGMDGDRGASSRSVGSVGSDCGRSSFGSEGGASRGGRSVRVVTDCTTPGRVPSGSEKVTSLIEAIESRGGAEEGQILTLLDRRHGDKSIGTRSATTTTTGRDVVSPAVVSRAKRLLLGVSNIDESAEVRKLASQALAALQGLAAS